MGATTNKPPTTVLVTSSRAYLMLALDGPSPRGRERGGPWCCVMSRHVKAGHVPIRGRAFIACIESTRVGARGFSPISTGRLRNSVAPTSALLALGHLNRSELDVHMKKSLSSWH